MRHATRRTDTHRCARNRAHQCALGDYSLRGRGVQLRTPRVKAALDPREPVTPIPVHQARAIQPLLPAKYSPLHGESGKGLQSVYLAALPEALGQLLSELVFRRGNAVRVSDARALQLASLELVERERWEQPEIRAL